MRHLPVFAIFDAARRFAWGEFPTVLRLTWMPVLGIMLAQLVVDRGSLVPVGVLPMPAAAEEVLRFLADALLSAASIALAMASLHRFVLFDDRNPGRYLPPRPRRVEILFFAVLLAPQLANAFMAFLLAVLASRLSWALPVRPLWLVYVAGQLFLIIRLSLLLPIIAVEQNLDLWQAWKLSRGNFWRLAAIGLLVSMTIFAAAVVVGALVWLALFVARFPAPVEYFLVPALGVPAIFVGAAAAMALSAASVAYSFLYLREVRSAEPSPP